MTVLLTALAIAVPGTWDGHCRTDQCTRNMRARVHHETVQRWRAAARPYAGWLARVRRCESGGNYHTATGNGYFGAYQFTLSSWGAVGGRGLPHEAAPAEQDYRAVRLLKLQGAGAWPVCG